MVRFSTAVIIPAWNESGSISHVIGQISENYQIIVVDDGSDDGTGELARLGGAEVVVHAHNRGYDAAIESGFRRAVEMNMQFIITLDADGQHDPNLIADIVAELLAGASVVVGRRPQKQRISEMIFGLVTGGLMGIHDPLCGMKGYRQEIFQEVGHFDCYDSVGTELMIYAAATKRIVTEIKVPISDRSDKPRFGATFGANKKILLACFRGTYRFINVRVRPTKAMNVFHRS